MSSVKLTVGDSPTAQVIARAVADVKVKDSAGRAITLQKPGILAQYRIVEVAGESAKNEVYMRMVLPIIYVTAIDADPIFQPVNKLQLEALIQRLDDHGVDAVMKGVLEHFGGNDPDADKAAIKK